MCRDVFKRILGFSFTLIILAYNNLQMLNSFINKTLEYIANLSFKNLFCIH